jgi:hypothetical protein
VNMFLGSWEITFTNENNAIEERWDGGPPP